MSRPPFLPRTLALAGAVIDCGDTGFHAAARGFFPLGETGFRSYNGLVAGTDGTAAGDEAALAATVANLEGLAADHAKRLRTLRKEAERGEVTARGHAPGLIAYLNISYSAVAAMHAGLFAPDELRFPLWAPAVRLFDLIQTVPDFQPQPDGSRWTAAVCQVELNRIAERRDALARALAGDVDRCAELFEYCQYRRLPARPGGEPKFTGRPAAPAPVLPPSAAPAQLSLFSSAV